MHGPAVEHLAHVFFVLDDGHHVEVAGVLETSDEVPAGGAVVEIIHGGGDVLDVGGHRIAKNHDLNDRHEKNYTLHLRVAEDMDELLDQHALDAFKSHTATFFLNLTMATVITTAPKRASKPASAANISRPMPFK